MQKEEHHSALPEVKLHADYSWDMHVKDNMDFMDGRMPRWALAWESVVRLSKDSLGKAFQLHRAYVLEVASISAILSCRPRRSSFSLSRVSGSSQAHSPHFPFAKRGCYENQYPFHHRGRHIGDGFDRQRLRGISRTAQARLSGYETRSPDTD